jgi:hypothetical protein
MKLTAIIASRLLATLWFATLAFAGVAWSTQVQAAVKAVKADKTHNTTKPSDPKSAQKSGKKSGKKSAKKSAHKTKVSKPVYVRGSEETTGERSARLQRECKGGVNAGACAGYTR